MCVRSAYHGHVSSLIDISPYKYHQRSDAEHNPAVHVVSAAPGAVHVSDKGEDGDGNTHDDTWERRPGRQEAQRIVGSLAVVAGLLAPSNTPRPDHPRHLS